MAECLNTQSLVAHPPAIHVSLLATESGDSVARMNGPLIINIMKKSRASFVFLLVEELQFHICVVWKKYRRYIVRDILERLPRTTN